MSVSKSSNLIVWQKWFDPFGNDDLPIEDFLNKEDHSNEEETEEYSQLHHNVIPIKEGSLKAIITPMGVIPYTENTASSKIFNFWVGHTNFNLSKKVVDLIENSEGVETLDIFTRYRFRIAIGKVFDDASVMTNINDTVYQHLDQEK
jgi:hypothetical protein